MNQQANYPDAYHDTYSKAILGFWVYLMTDCILFATLFTTYAVLHVETFGGPGGSDLFSLPSSLAETFILLTSSFTCGLGMLAAYRNEKKGVFAWFGVAFVLGVSFLAIEITEFSHLIQGGNSWQRSAFLSSYFTLVGTHGLHVTCGLLWMIVLMAQIASRGLIASTFRRLVCLSMFWHFLDLIWIFIFTIVYLGAKI